MNSTFKRIILAGTATLLLGGVALAQEMITVKPGDTLTAIAIENFGKANLAQSICDANMATLHGNCDALEIGAKLVLPEMAMEASMEKADETMTAEEKATMEKAEMEKATMEKEAMEKAEMEKATMEMEKATMEKEAMEKAEMEKATMEAEAMEMADGEHAMAACMDAAAGEAGAIEKCKMAATEMAPAK